VVALQDELSRAGLQQALGLKDEKHFRKAYLLPALDSGLVEMTRPETPRSSKQRYRLTALGQRWLDAHSDGRESIPADIRQRLLANVWCGQCRHGVTITNFTGTINGGNLLLVGKCAECHGDVARVIEGS
jgi:hypothetical protein